MAKGPISLGEVAVTDAYDLDADIVIHAAAMSHFDDASTSEAAVAKATAAALRAADTHGCRSVVLPILGTGTAGLDFERGAETVCEVVATYDAVSINHVSIIAYDDDQFATLSDIADRYDAR